MKITWSENKKSENEWTGMLFPFFHLSKYNRKWTLTIYEKPNSPSSKPRHIEVSSAQAGKSFAAKYLKYSGR